MLYLLGLRGTGLSGLIFKLAKCNICGEEIVASDDILRGHNGTLYHIKCILFRVPKLLKEKD